MECFLKFWKSYVLVNWEGYLRLVNDPQFGYCPNCGSEIVSSSPLFCENSESETVCLFAAGLLHFCFKNVVIFCVGIKIAVEGETTNWAHYVDWFCQTWLRHVSTFTRITTANEARTLAKSSHEHITKRI